MDRYNVVCISNDPQLLITLSQEISDLETKISLYGTIEEAESLTDEDNTFFIIHIDKNFSFNFIEQYHEKTSWIGLIDTDNYPLLFPKLNLWDYEKIQTLPIAKGKLATLLKKLLTHSQINDVKDSINPRYVQKIQQLEQKLKSTKQAADAKQAELQQITAMLEANLAESQSSREQMIPIISALINLRTGKPLNSATKPAQLAHEIALKYGLSEEECKEIYNAGLLYNIGQVALNDDLVGKPYNSLTKEQQKEFDNIVIKSQAILKSIPMFEKISEAIRHLFEAYDGSGFPDNLSGQDIPVYSRILLPAIDYYELQQDDYFKEKVSDITAEHFVVNNKSKKYDPDIIKYFIVSLHEEALADKEKTVDIPLSQARPGMILAKPLKIQGATNHLSAGEQLTQTSLDKLLSLQADRDSEVMLTIFEHSKFIISL